MMNSVCEKMDLLNERLAVAAEAQGQQRKTTLPTKFIKP
jgi:hypothetical protein